MQVRSALVAAALAGVSLAGFAAQPAEAADYGISVSRYCSQNHYASASYRDFNNPYSWYCSNAPYFGTYGVDMAKACRQQWPGSYPVIVQWNVMGWRCRR